MPISSQAFNQTPRNSYIYLGLSDLKGSADYMSTRERLIVGRVTSKVTHTTKDEYVVTRLYSQLVCKNFLAKLTISTIPTASNTFAYY